MIVGITRVRNEALIFEDTLRHFSAFCDGLVVYDDCSTDATPEIAKDLGARLIRGDHWDPNRIGENTRHRKLAMHEAIAMGASWCLCFDADERLQGQLPDLRADGYRFRLFDGYMTPETQRPYSAGPLADLPRRWGPEYRDIVMLFRADRAAYDHPGQRQPRMQGRVEQADVLVKHYGKCLSVEHWEETCRYYIDYFPQWRAKWLERLGRAIHTRSDFDRPLYAWDEVAAHGVAL